MQFSFIALTESFFNYEKGDTASTHVETSVKLFPSDNLDHSVYLEKGGLPTQEGMKAIVKTLTQGLVGAIHVSHEQGWEDSAKLLRSIIEDLTEGFAAVATVQVSELSDTAVQAFKDSVS